MIFCSADSGAFGASVACNRRQVCVQVWSCFSGDEVLAILGAPYEM